MADHRKRRRPGTVRWNELLQKDDLVRYLTFFEKKENIKSLTELLQTTRITPKKEINEYIEKIPSTPLKDGISLYDFQRRSKDFV